MSIKHRGFARTARPTSAVEGQIIWNTDDNQLEIYDGTGWKAIDKTSANETYYKYRTIITTSYVLGGYKSGVPWKNVNRMVHATDACTNLGDLLSYAGSYTSGNCSLTTAWLYSSDDNHPGYSSQTVAMNMVTETNAGYGGSMNMKTGRGDSAAMFKEHYFGYIAAGGSNYTDTHNLTTNVMYSNYQYSDGFSWNDADSSSAFSGETKGYAWDNTYGRVAQYSTDSQSAFFNARNQGSMWGAHGQQKGICSKVTKAYAGNEGTYNGGYNLRRWNYYTEMQDGTIAKPIGNCGEENFDMGQDWQYMISMYDGLQNNRGWKFSYSTDSGYELGAGSIRTGVPGASSGHCGWRP